MMAIKMIVHLGENQDTQFFPTLAQANEAARKLVPGCSFSEWRSWGSEGRVARDVFMNPAAKRESRYDLIFAFLIQTGN